MSGELRKLFHQQQVLFKQFGEYILEFFNKRGFFLDNNYYDRFLYYSAERVYDGVREVYGGNLQFLRADGEDDGRCQDSKGSSLNVGELAGYGNANVGAEKESGEADVLHDPLQQGGQHVSNQLQHHQQFSQYPTRSLELYTCAIPHETWGFYHSVSSSDGDNGALEFTSREVLIGSQAESIVDTYKILLRDLETSAMMQDLNLSDPETIIKMSDHATKEIHRRFEKIELAFAAPEKDDDKIKAFDFYVDFVEPPAL